MRLSLLGLTFAVLSFFAKDLCSAPQTDVAFDRFAADFVTGYLGWRPAEGVSLGLHEYDGRVTDFSRRSLDTELARLKEADRQLAAIPVQKLSPRAGRSGRAACDYRLLQATIRKALFKFQDQHSYTRNPMTYAGAIDVNIYIKRNFAPLPERVRSIIAVLRQAAKIMADARANLETALPKPFIETAIQVSEGSADFLGKDLVDALKELKDQSLRTEFTTANKAAISELRNYVTWLKEEKLPNANNDYPLGRAKFAQMLRDSEFIDLSPEQLLDLGLRELHREQQILAETAKKIDPTREPIEVLKQIQKDHPTAESLIPDTRKNLEAIRQFLVDRHIITIPSEVRPRVEETPQFERATSFASMDTPGPFETRANEAYYYVTPVEKDWSPQQKEQWLTAFNYYTTDVVTIHEAYPGHYTQFLCLNASPANRLEKIFNSYAFVEGWAHYTEQMMLDEGFGRAGRSGPNMPSASGQSAALVAAKYRLAQSDEALLRLCRLCCSIKLHCQNMTVDEATRFFQENCYYEEKPAHQEAIRGTFDPEYLYYTLGKLQILKLRRDWQQQEGRKFTLQRFHDEMLRHGAPPLRLLRELLLKDPSKWGQLF
ncbi:MAG TPA: DUF885 domain-containing protein [Verrucomicrobiae bacterium]|nr:DUF885 domain-containing protein [Verrucomicrobiae bacterium]